MRILPIITAALVMGFLYLLVFERDALDAFTGRQEAARAGETANGAGGGAAGGAQAGAAEGAAEEGAPGGEKPRIRVVVSRSEARPLEDMVLLRGQTEAAREVAVMAETSGRVIGEPLPKGARVEEGQILCRLDPDVRPARLEEARARLEEARINYTAARRLQDEGFASRTRATAAEAALRSAEAAVAVAEAELARTEIRAPFSGLLESDTAELGALLGPGQPCATVIDLDPIRLVGYAPETAVDRIRPGARAGARLTDGRTLAGSVSFISRRADPLTRTFRVEVQAANGDMAVRAGQTAEILIATEPRPAHLVMQSALTLNDDGALGLRIVDDITEGDGIALGIVRFRPVRLLRDTPEGVWLTGLPDTAEVIVRGQEYVTEGVQVEVARSVDGGDSDGKGKSGATEAAGSGG